MIKSVVFDIGATLVTGPPVAPNKVISEALGSVTHAEVSSVIMTQPTKTAQDAVRIVESLAGRISEEAKSAIAQLWTDQCSAPKALPGAVEAVCKIRELGMKIGLLSDIWTPYYKGVEQAIPEVVGAAEAVVLSCLSGKRKPDIHNFDLISDELHLNQEDIVMVGDTYTHDIAPAIQCGMHTVWVLARPDREKQAIMDILNGHATPPSITVEDISCVPHAIKRLMQAKSA